MDTELLAATAILVIAGWIALRLRESQRSKSDPLQSVSGERDDLKEI